MPSAKLLISILILADEISKSGKITQFHILIQKFHVLTCTLGGRIATFLRKIQIVNQDYGLWVRVLLFSIFACWGWATCHFVDRTISESIRTGPASLLIFCVASNVTLVVVSPTITPFFSSSPYFFLLSHMIV